MKFIKKYKFFFLILIILIGGFSLYHFKPPLEKENYRFIKENLITPELKRLIIKYVYLIDPEIVERYIHADHLNRILMEVDKKKDGSDIKIKYSNVNLSNNKTLEKYTLDYGYNYIGISKSFKTAYIEKHQNNIILLSTRGILSFRQDLADDGINFKQIKNNIDYFIGEKQFLKNPEHAIKDMLISNDKILISFTEEIHEDCWNLSLLYGKMNYKNIKFKKIFSSDKCVTKINDRGENIGFSTQQAGGRIFDIDKNNFLLTVGDFGHRYLAQDRESINGKIIKINKNTGEHKIISMGHRNPQGLYYDKKNNLILQSEHGPMGGDEINLIEFDNMNEDKILNFGWPLASYGEHYLSNIKKFSVRYPIPKSHDGFVEPLIYFIPSIAISELEKVGENKYVVSSMGLKKVGTQSLHFFELNEEKEIINIEQLEVYERLRDIVFNDNKLYLYMENTGSIGVINLN